MNNAIYVRVSTDEQNLETQLRAIQDRFSGEIYSDEGFSGDTIQRPAMKRLRADIASGKITHVIVFRLDRISRRTATGISLLHNWLDSGVRITSVMENLDIDPSNHTVVDIVVPLLFGLAANEQRVRRQRQRAGIDRARSEDKYRGRKPGSTVAKPARAKVLKAKGLTLMEVAETLGVSKATVCRYLKA